VAYVPIEGDSLPAGMLASATPWHTLTDNHGEVYAEYGPPIAAVQAYTFRDATVATTVLRFQMPANEDNLDLAVRVRWKKDAGPTSITMTVLVDASSIGTVTTTSTSYTNSTLTGTPTGTGTREILVQLHRTGGSGGDEAHIEALAIYVVGAAPAAGALGSGFIRADSGWYTANQPIPSERVARLTNGPTKIAKDRPACLHTLAQDLNNTGARATSTDSTSYVVVYRSWVPAPDYVERSVRLHLYIGTSAGGTPDALVEYAGQTWNVTAAGWATTTMTTQFLGGGWLTIRMKRTAGSGYVYPGTLQLWREPA